MRNFINKATQFIFLFVFFGALAISADAGTFTVNSTANAADANTTDNVCDVDAATAGEQCTLRAAIQQANATTGLDTINFDPVVFALAQSILVSSSTYPQITDDLTITGTGLSLLTINGTGNRRVFNIGEGAVVIISNLTVTGGFAGESVGGGILNSGDLTLNNVAVRNNEVSFGSGGGIFNGGTLTITNSVIHNNEVTGFDGGGIANGGTLTITNSEIYANTAANMQEGFGGGISNTEGTVNITNSTIRDNNAGSNGGGIYNGAGTLTVTTSNIRDNTTQANGGGVYTDGGTVGLTRSTVNGNDALNGAGIYNTNGAVSLDNSTISGNIAGNIGGGYYGFGDLFVTTLSSSASTIAFNIATLGGGIAVSSSVGASSARIGNTIVGSNTATSGPNISSPTAIGASPVFSDGYNLVESSTGGFFVAVTTDITGFPPGLLQLANNGGPTPTHALNNNSPAIDKGSSTGTDQRGITRPIDNPAIPPATGGNNSDIGAFEAAAGTTAASVTLGGRVVSFAGRSILNARVVLIEADGTVRQTLTNSFGYYRFTDVAAGQTAILEVRSKRFGFVPQVINISEEMSNLNFIAQP